MRKIASSLLILLSATPADAHGVEQSLDGASWTFDSWIIVPLLAFGGMYAIGALTLSQRRGWNGGARSWRDIACLVGWLSLAAALISPLHWLGERLFTFHMVEHEIIMAVAAPLIAIARPVGTLFWSLPRRTRLNMGRLMRHSVTRTTWNWLSAGRNATLLHGVAIWAWHAPVLFDAAVDNLLLHRLQHLSFFATAVLFWWSVFRRSETGAAAWHVFVTMLHTSLLGALMALAPRVLYQQQTTASAAWGLTPLEDQQLAGIIMWVPAGTIYAGAALALIAIWIKGAGKTAGQADVVAP
ncbi:cytochrome c oxidase assembly protein [Bradyrhizobium neotropicale]|uniref:cytochrome c oxidase assembly protein n=1 Tax=Bradyrhizobium neotropicale TaxID=1497615 RepID=UPI001AD6B417|nr:cytochrome c oxidase assembly protein [Bradyrhizobium neotropicale]MBO4220940.1 cytochrome c oxidase assembly protein [Bradyrhizobium neotropicale]